MRARVSKNIDGLPNMANAANHFALCTRGVSWNQHFGKAFLVQRRPGTWIWNEAPSDAQKMKIDCVCSAESTQGLINELQCLHAELL